MTATTQQTLPTREELVARAAELQPLLREHAAAGEMNRRQADEVIDALTDAGLFRLMKPSRFGGYGGSLRTVLEVTEALGEADGSTGWVVAIAAAGALATSRGSEQAQAEIFANPDARIAGAGMPATARRVDDGLRITGRWGYASGSPHATWSMLAAAVIDEAGQSGDAYFCLVPASQVQLEDTWRTVGMRGTGSNTWVAQDLFVPQHLLIPMAALIDGTRSGVIDNPMRRLPFPPVAVLALIGPVLGLGRAALGLVIDQTASKGMHHTIFTRQRDSVGVQVQVAEAALKLQTARLHAHHIADELDRKAADGQGIGYDYRAQVRGQCGYAVQQVLDAINLLLNVHGAAAFAETSPLQRYWRDANTGARHAGLNALVGYEIFGKALLGVQEQISAMV